MKQDKKVVMRGSKMNNKKVVLVVALVLLVVGLLSLRGGNRLGVAFSEPGFTSIVETQINCSSANASTAVANASPGRVSFIAENTGAQLVYLCRHGGTCTATSGITLYATSTGAFVGDQSYEQRDGYTGYYTCRAAGATTTLDVSYSQ